MTTIVENAHDQSIPQYKRIVMTKGPAVGKITGINHMVLYTNDIRKSITFYRDILGLKIVRTQQFSPSAMAAASDKDRNAGQIAVDKDSSDIVRQVFFEMGNGELLSLYEAKEVTDTPNAPLVPFLWPPANTQTPKRADKLDHLAFNVRTREELVWFHKHLTDHGVPVSGVIDRQGEHRFVVSIYFSDPSNNPLEIATLDLDNPAWEGYDFTTWFRDEEPVEELLG